MGSTFHEALRADSFDSWRGIKLDEGNVRFNDIVVVHLLPWEEALEAQETRYGTWRSAPTHDEYWDGDENCFREKELTKDELKELLFDLKLRRVLPNKLYTMVTKYRMNKKAGKSTFPRNSLSRRASGLFKRRSKSAKDTPTVVLHPINPLKESTGPSPEDVAKMESYFERLNRMDQERKPTPRKNPTHKAADSMELHRDFVREMSEELLNESARSLEVESPPELHKRTNTSPLHRVADKILHIKPRGRSRTNSSKNSFTSKRGKKSSSFTENVDDLEISELRLDTGRSFASTESDVHFSKSNKNEKKIDKFFSKLEQLDGLTRTPVRRNKRAREALISYRDGSYSFQLLKADLNVV